jgi:hypothetical protein
LRCSIRRKCQPFTERWPWIVAFVFGLLHGFGFAGALAGIGLPDHAILTARQRNADNPVGRVLELALEHTCRH